VVNGYFYGGSYEVSKAAMIMLTKTLATEWAQYGINIKAIAPGYYDTQPNRDFFIGKPDLHQKVLDLIPLGDGQPGAARRTCPHVVVRCGGMHDGIDDHHRRRLHPMVTDLAEDRNVR